MSRSTGTDLLRGTGLGLPRADVVVRCATSFRREADMARAVLAARPAHLVYVSIAGCDRRATQFHSLLRGRFDRLSKLPLMPVPGFRFQPVDEAEVGLKLATLAQSAPAGVAPEFGGPEIHKAADLARMYLAATGKRRTIKALKVPGATYRAYHAGGHLSPGRAVGKRTFENYLS